MFFMRSCRMAYRGCITIFLYCIWTEVLNETNNYLINIRKADYREKWSTHLNKRNNLPILQFALKSQNELRDVWRTLKEIKTEHFSQTCGD